jgi:predicted MPP superfamily phosphohydrolase
MRFFLFFGIVQSILFFGHWFLYKTLISFFGVTYPAKLWILRIVLGALSVSLIGSSFLSFRYSTLPVRYLYTVSVSWLGILYLLVLTSTLAWVIFSVMKLFHFSMDRRTLMVGLIALGLMACVYGFWNATAVRIKTVTLPLPNLPESWKDKTAVWISDIHLGQVRNHRFAQEITKRIQELRPDIVFIGGDLFDGGEAMDLNHMVEPLSKISSSYGSYFITGNHEEFYDNTPYLQAVRGAGIRVLDNEKVELDGLQIIGVGFRASRNQEQFRGVLHRMKIDREKPSILLKHAPVDLKIASDEGISAQISGHTHLGQVFLFRFITSWIYKGYDYGLKRFGDLQIYTSSGVGTWGPPMRIDTYPEIVVIRFTKK